MILLNRPLPPTRAYDEVKPWYSSPGMGGTGLGNSQHFPFSDARIGYPLTLLPVVDKFATIRPNR